MEKYNAITVHEHNIQLLAIEMYKVKNDIKPNVLGNFVTNREERYNTRHHSQLFRDRANSTNYGWNLLEFLGQKFGT